MLPEGFYDMGFDVSKIFLPSVGVDLVLNMNTDFPISKSSIIYDSNFKKRTITVAQPATPITPNTQFEQLHLTTLVYLNQRRSRIGLRCKSVKFINDYPMANGALTKALVVEYQLPATESNIRSAFRLPVGSRYTVKAKLVYNKQEYRTPSDFKIKDISFSGLGLVILEKKGKDNALYTLNPGTELIMGLALVDKDQPGAVGTFPIKIKVARINSNYSETHTLIGLQITSITQENESVLNQFIHAAQIDELKRISKKG